MRTGVETSLGADERRIVIGRSNDPNDDDRH
jgi:hypothetical protein